ncbi:MAG: GspE/PulE family protein [Patescibacteria group bacterium]
MKIIDIKGKLEKIKREAEERDAQRRAKKNNFSYLNLITAPINVEAIGLIPEKEARALKTAAIEVKNKELGVAVHDPTLPEFKRLTENLKEKGYKVMIFVVSLSSLEHAYNFYNFVSLEKNKITGSVGVAGDTNQKIGEFNSIKKVEIVLETLKQAPADVAGFLEMILIGASQNRASDIHFEAMKDFIKLRFRIDGVLHDVYNRINKNFYSYLISRIKLLSGLKINIRDEVQDGRFTVNFQQKNIEIRVAITPSEFGEVIVMRILDPEAINLSLLGLGIREDDLEIIKNELKRPNGLILNTGPTGSGKTTTLYTFLKYKKTPDIKIITIEDPIEYHLEGIEQTQVDEDAGYTFTNGLRSLMRQDPDMILVGEIRDKETAEIGIQAALTGHLVLSTVHANSAAGAIPRLLDLGAKPSSIGPALNLVIAQRLVRRLCKDCRKKVETTQEIKEKIEIFINNLSKRVNKINYKEIEIFEPLAGGCEKCNNSGYKGRVGIYELLLNDPEYEKFLIDQTHTNLSSHKELEELILGSASEGQIKKFASEQGVTTMQQDGILKVIRGITTFEEVEAVTGTISWK